ncbi:DUF2269 domain-containing protein [Asticcacaulis sp. SL142]|uniref:DUF2269 family protein n=1 Tax=Asticcacaulis sp. SL142 TaxID=2995155 RepID=UPI00226CAF93|nr:DUF2269 domain-containing protein [Asticcacaulis sp. SL142]WAC48736.1 DUF2269 domain-containing protein [Asticcacaulis sp. SL142]
MSYELIKWVHILSSTILFGTGIGSAFYMFVANRSKDTRDIYFAVRHVVIADWLFTTPAVIVQLLSGLYMVHMAGYSLMDVWILWGLLLYVFAGACWVPVVWMQIKMRDMARIAVDTGTPLPEHYWRLDRWWITLGSLAFPAIVVVFWLMVSKPV